MPIYRNPTPVVVILYPWHSGLLGVRRGINPKHGEIALPGGYHELGETWQQACARELYEETGVEVPASGVHHFWTESVVRADGSDKLFIFGYVPYGPSPDINFKCDETLELKMIMRGERLAFPIHETMVDRWFATQIKREPIF